MRIHKVAVLVAAPAAVVAGILARQDAAGAAAQQAAAGEQAALVARGRYLVTAFGCGDCHTPLKMGAHGPEPDLTHQLSGHPHDAKLPPPPAPSGPWIWSGDATGTAFAGPWGISWAANLTPDPTTGLGSWTPKLFIATMRTGKHFGVGRVLLPPMPWRSIGRLDDEDLTAVFEYLRTIPAVHNLVPDAEVAAAPK